MTNVRRSEEHRTGDVEKDPDAWVTDNRPMTGAQASYLIPRSEEERTAFDDTLTKADASKRNDALQVKVGRRVS